MDEVVKEKCISSRQHQMPWHFDDERSRDLVVPHLLLRIINHPEASNPECGDREHSGQAAHECIGETQIGALNSYDAQSNDDPAERCPAPRPERDVIGEQQQGEVTVMYRSPAPLSSQ